MNDALQKALRAEMLEVLNEGEGLTVIQCSTLMRLSEAARDLLQARGRKPEDFKDGTHHAGDEALPAVNTETYGVKMLRELLPLLQQSFRPKPTVDTTELVKALAEARRLGLTDIAEQIEAKLDVPRAQPIPVLYGTPEEKAIAEAKARNQAAIDEAVARRTRELEDAQQEAP